MFFKLVRKKGSAIGNLLKADGSHFCYTIESASRKIPPGVCTASIYNSPVHGRVWRLNNVPGRLGIELHISKDAYGNLLDYSRSEFLEGCITPGTTLCKSHSEDAVCGCISAFSSLMMATELESQITIEIVEQEVYNVAQPIEVRKMNSTGINVLKVVGFAAPAINAALNHAGIQVTGDQSGEVTAFIWGAAVALFACGHINQLPALASLLGINVGQPQKS